MRFLSITTMILLAAASGFAARAPRTIDPEASCSTAECHAGMDGKQYVHGPVAMGECQVCHDPKGKKHEFKEMAPGVELCGSCHDTYDQEANLHMPVQDDCLNCHDPHGSNTKGMLITDNQGELCFTCHDQGIMEGKYQHGPAAVGACTICHNPHASAQEKLLLAAGNDLCAICHTDFIADMTSGSFVHKPVKENCANCHNPHSGPRPKMLPGTVRELCAKCHQDVVQRATEAAVGHGPVEDPDGCVKCHLPHGSSVAPLLKAEESALCLGCHDKPIKATDGADLQNMKKLLEENEGWHGPLREGGCSGCHSPHGGAHFRLLKEAYPAKFYSPYEPKNYALCFTCHEPTMAKEQYTKRLTGFRDGDQNLHFLHVNKAERGRTCRACHEVHASPLPRHLRESVPYGNWALPIGFNKTENGGSCQPGCHAEVTYDRNKTGS